MKTILVTRVARPSARSAAVGLLCGCLLAWPSFAADAAEEKKEASAPAAEESSEEYRNWFDLSVGNSFLKGDQARYRERHQLPRDAVGGVEDFHFEHDLGKKGIFKVDGRGIFDISDYLLKLEASHPDIGYVRAGYREYRSWSDGSGGFFPGGNLWFSLYPEELSLDRGEVWFQGGLTLPNLPSFEVAYRHQFTDGMKDSTIWGDTSTRGLAADADPNLRGILPSFWLLDEQRDIFSVDVKHSIGKTAFGAGGTYEHAQRDDSLNIRRRPEAGAPTRGSKSRYLTQSESQDSDVFNVHAFSETKFNEKVWLTLGYAYTLLDADFSGSRIYGTDYERPYDARPVGVGVPPEYVLYTGFTNLFGDSEMKQHVVNLNLMLMPWKHVYIVPAARIEINDLDGASTSVQTAAPGVGDAVASERAFVDVSESLEVRYTGLTNWLLYARGYWLQGSGDLAERAQGRNVVNRETDFDRFTQKYTLGANWYPARRVHLGFQYYHKARNNNYSHRIDDTPNLAGLNRYPAYLTEQDFDTDDLNLRITLRPANNLSFVTRYDYQLSTIQSGAPDRLTNEGADQTGHVLSETVTWSPLARLYLQGSASYILDQTESAASVLTGSVLTADNDYWTASGTAGYALTQRTDVTATYTYYLAHNFDDNSALGQPFGAGQEEHGVMAGITHRLRKNLTWSLKYGFFHYRDKTSGERNNYQAQLVYSTVQYRF